MKKTGLAILATLGLAACKQTPVIPHLTTIDLPIKPTLKVIPLTADISTLKQELLFERGGPGLSLGASRTEHVRHERGFQEGIRQRI